MAGTLTITGRGGRSLKVGLFFLAATTVISASVGAALGAVGRVTSSEIALLGAALVACLYAAAYVRHGRIPFIAWPPQLPSRWLDRGHPLRTAFRYGLAWGFTFATPIRAGSLVALAFVVVAIGDVLVGSALFAAVGFVKSLPTALAPLRPPGEEKAKRHSAVVRAWQRPLATTLDVFALASVLALTVHALALA
jgi:hypothetical protein